MTSTLKKKKKVSFPTVDFITSVFEISSLEHGKANRAQKDALEIKERRSSLAVGFTLMHMHAAAPVGPMGRAGPVL